MYLELAWIISDPSRSLDERWAQIHHNVTTPLAAEVLVMRAALQAAALLNVTHLRMFSDNQTLIRAINVKLFEEKKIYGIVKDIEATFLLFIDLSFFFLPKGENWQIDALTKSILRNPNYVTC